MSIILCLLLSAEITSDKVFTYTYTYELKCYNIEHDLTNTSLLFSLNEDFTDVKKPERKYTLTEATKTNDGFYYLFKTVLNKYINNKVDVGDLKAIYKNLFKKKKGTELKKIKAE
ncbi:60S ribosomal protein L5 [Onygenales sp. PD_10]|nr:60S ribosomal protein L5 [Onygenales sp. PD_10]